MDESFLVNEAEEKSDEAAEEPTVEIIEEKAKKSHPHRGRKLHDALPDHPNVELTNNLAERTVKPFVINRKNFLFSDTEKGADASAAAMSIIETAKRNGLDIYGYLLFLLNTLPELGADLSDEQLESVMPWNDTLPDYCKAAYSEIL